MMQDIHHTIQGLSSAEVAAARARYGPNKLHFKKENAALAFIKGLIKEPMVILLLITSTIYFIGGNTGDGLFMAAAILLVSAISLYQDARSRTALEKLKSFTQVGCKVIREGRLQEIAREELVVGDSLIVEEGTSIAGDGIIIHANDFSVNEAILTGESLPAFKDQNAKDNVVYQGTTVASGLAVASVTAIGNATQLGRIGKSLENIAEEKTPLELQITDFVKKMVVAGVIVFIVVWAINYFRSFSITDSLLKALTLAMSILPEEIPVAFTTFMALGAWRLMKLGIVVKQMKTVETLGSATVICTDKTGTLTESQMSLAKLYSLQSRRIASIDEHLNEEEIALITSAMWASEPIPFDPMDVALHRAYVQCCKTDERQHYTMVHEYPLAGVPPMMTHVFEDSAGKRIIAAKGAPEALLAASDILKDDWQRIHSVIKALTGDGYRVLGVGEAMHKENPFPTRQQEFLFHFKGVVAFYDPPKKNIRLVLQQFYEAGISVKIITGDYAATTAAIARQIEFKGAEQSMSGKEIMHLTNEELEARAVNTNIFTRMFPEAKLKIINALKSRKEIVAMTGDGVNDAPALKAAHIGIAMGKKGTEIAKQAASLILANDDLSGMVEAVAMGRRIYTNLKKAIQYIISIHIPIILTVFIPLVLGWIYPNIFTPVHIIFLELIMGPTCSIIYENEPMEQNTMSQPPRPFTKTFFNWHELVTSIVQGLLITAGTLTAYQLSVYWRYDETLTRTMVFIVLISANVLLTLVNRSFYYSVFTTIKYPNHLIPLIIGITVFISTLLLYVKPLSDFFRFTSPNAFQLLVSISIGFLSVIWFELIKWRRRTR